MLVFWSGSLPFLVRCTSHLVLLTWVILGSPFWNLLFGTFNPFRAMGWTPSVPVSEGVEIRHGCQFLSSLIRALAKLPGGLGRFMPCSLGSRMSRLRHVGWNQCSHGLNSRPLESCHHQCLKATCGVLGYPKSAALELLDGTLKLRHCTDLFTNRCPPLVFIWGWLW